MTVETALDLAEQGFKVFPLKSDGKPYTENGFKNSSQDPNIIMEAWDKHPDALIGVYTGGSGLVVLDLDLKVDAEGNALVDGFTSLDEAWLDVPETFAYDSRGGLGRHLVYRAPEGVNLPRSMGYRDMSGVDRCSGEGYVAWMGDVPQPNEIAEAPEWLLETKEVRATFNFEGDLAEWFDQLVEGDPNALVRRAIEKINDDMTHSDMVEAQHSAIRLGAEGNSGIPVLLEALHEAWMNRPAENHTTPEVEWDFKFAEALQSGLEKFGALTDTLKNLPDYSIALVPASVPDMLVTKSGTKADFSKLLGLLVKEVSDDNLILSILWNSPGTKKWARDWGLEFVAKRIQEARIKPEPTRENPRVEEERATVEKGKTLVAQLLTPEEREYLKTRPTFVDRVEKIAIDMGYDQLAYFRAIGWMMGSLRYGMKGFVPVSDTQLHGLNLWNIIMGFSGTGKSVVDSFRDQVLDRLFDNDNECGTGYDLGTDSSPQGLHMALLERDGKASLFSADEASGFFKTLGKREWDSGLEDTLSDWYMGRVAPSNKINLKDLRGKSARTSFNMQMFATPERLAETLSRDQFKSGFLARVMWSFGEPKKKTDDMFNIFKDSADNVKDVEVVPEVIQDIISDLASSVAWIDKPLVLKPTKEAKIRMSQAYEAMVKFAEDRENWDIIEPAITRHMEAMLKCAGIAAMYREDTKIELVDALHAIKAVEEWFRNLSRVADLISAGQFQRRSKEIETWVIASGGTVTRTSVFHRFRNFIEKDGRELDSLLTYLVESGTLNRDENGMKYTLNGG